MSHWNYAKLIVNVTNFNSDRCDVRARRGVLGVHFRARAPPVGQLARGSGRGPPFFWGSSGLISAGREARRPDFGGIDTESGQTLQGSFSAVSKPHFASKYSLESSRRDLHNALLSTVLQSQNFSQKSSSFFRDWIIEFPIFFIFYVEFCIFSANFWWNFVRISRQIPEKSDVCRFFNRICENKLENCRKFWNLWK